MSKDVNVVFIEGLRLSLAISGLFVPDENQPLLMSSQESCHLVDECVI